ncbi:MAG TPA: hypothetical protein VIC25_11395 [Caulobacteraceae bacterium]|jgi:hypothetical protein
MRPTDAAGLVGVVLMLGAYIGAQLGRLNPARAPSLVMNFAGASLVMYSLLFAFNLSAFLTEAAWAVAAAFGLARLALRRE